MDVLDIVVVSAIFYAVIQWGSSVKEADTKRPNKMMQKAGSVVSEKPDTWETAVDWRMLARLQPVDGNVDLPLHRDMVGQEAS